LKKYSKYGDVEGFAAFASLNVLTPISETETEIVQPGISKSTEDILFLSLLHGHNHSLIMHDIFFCLCSARWYWMQDLRI
jgi:hypothetical protein